MNYVLSFDRAAILIATVLLWIYIFRPKFKNLSSRIYQVLMFMVVVASVLEILTCLVIESPAMLGSILTKILFAIYYYVCNLAPPLYYRYAIEITAQDKIKKYQKTLFSLSLIANFCLVSSIFVSDTFVYFDENGFFQHGRLFYALYFVSFSMMLLAGIQFFKYRKYLNRIQKFAVMVFYVFNIGALIYERYVAEINILMFVTALFMFVLYVSMQNPEYYVDAEIGCYNEEAFLEVCKNKLNNSKPFTIISFYSAAYEYVTQTFGAEYGVELTKYVSEYFTEKFKYHNLFHISDCNFVYISNHKKKYVEETYKKVWNDFDMEFEINQMKISLQGRGAAIVVPDIVDTPEDILDAVYFSRNKYLNNNTEKLCFIDSEFLSEKHRKERMAQLIKEQISFGGFELRYLPIFDMRKDKIVAAEALVRLFDDQLGEIKPSEFIEIAEEYGLVYDIDKLIFDKVCKFLKKIESQNFDIQQMQINLSTLEIMQGESIEYWLNKMDAISIDPSKLNFEIKESVCRSLNSNLTKNMERLKEKGCTFAIDNYGTGFSNVIELLNMDFQLINIDRSILWEAMKSDEAMNILENMILMFKELNYKVLATGVENRAQFEAVKCLQVDYIKGYIISRPVVEDEFIQMLSKNA
jgi:EAL domain-containing protein (putative c-di-GMP-specific phosphodiesterase class I)